MKSSPSFWLRSVLTLPLLGLALIATSACGPSFNDAYMATDSAGMNKATTFEHEGQEIHCVIDFVGGDEDTLITTLLTTPPNSGLRVSDNEIYPRPTSEKTGPVHIDVQLFLFDIGGMKTETGPWPSGEYSMDLSIDGAHEETLPFTVE